MACAFSAARLFPSFSQMSVDLPFQTYYVFFAFLVLPLAVLLWQAKGGALLPPCSTCWHLSFELELVDLETFP